MSSQDTGTRSGQQSQDPNEGSLADRRCVPCRGGVPPLALERVRELVSEVDGWHAEGVHHIDKEYTFPDFKSALAFVNRVGEVAEAEAHHPDITLTWGRVHIEVRTHKIDGLTENDFILAAKIDRLQP